ncbi:MAG: phosphoribosylanthranilate isomerase, partial [Ilumatobacteraceae bacterium]
DDLPDRVFDVAARSGVKAVQLHGHETARHVAQLSENVRWILKPVAAGSTEAARANQYGTDLVLVDAPEPGSGRLFDWKLVDEIPGGLRLILAGGLTPENVGSAIDIVKPWGVDVSSGVERSPGRKDPLKVKYFIERARESAPEQYLGDDDLPYDWDDE